MKYSIKTITPSEWLNIINKEADPDMDKYELNYYKLGNGYLVHIHSGLGNFVSPAYRQENVTDEQLEEYLDKATKDVELAYKKKKELYAPFNKFLGGSVGADKLF